MLQRERDRLELGVDPELDQHVLDVRADGVQRKVGEPKDVGAVVQAALLAVDDRETALDAQAASPWGCLGR